MWALSLFSNMFKNKLKWFQQLSACAALGGGRSQPCQWNLDQVTGATAGLKRSPSSVSELLSPLGVTHSLHFFLMFGPCKVSKDEAGLWSWKSAFRAEEREDVRGKSSHSLWEKELEILNEGGPWILSLRPKTSGSHWIKESIKFFYEILSKNVAPHVLLCREHTWQFFRNL